MGCGAAAALRGGLKTVSRSLGVTAATLRGWRDAFVAAGKASLASHPAEGEEPDSERRKTWLGEMLLERELFATKVAALEAGRPLARRKSRPCAVRACPAAASPEALRRCARSGQSPTLPSIGTAGRGGPCRSVAWDRLDQCQRRSCWRRSAVSSTTAPCMARVIARSRHSFFESFIRMLKENLA